MHIQALESLTLNSDTFQLEVTCENYGALYSSLYLYITAILEWPFNNLITYNLDTVNIAIMHTTGTELLSYKSCL